MSAFFKGVLSCLGLMILVSCSRPAAYQDYQALEAQPHDIIYKSAKEAIRSSQAVSVIPDDFTVAQIRISDPVLRLGDTLSNFQVFKTGPLTKGAYILDVRSRCISCAGYHRKQVLPHLVLVNSQGQEVSTFKQSTSLMPSIFFALHFNILESDSLKILVAADNRYTHKADAIFLQPRHNSINLPITQEYGPEGNVSFKLTKVE